MDTVRKNKVNISLSMLAPMSGNKPETDTDSDCSDSNFEHNHFC